MIAGEALPPRQRIWAPMPCGPSAGEMELGGVGRAWARACDRVVMPSTALPERLRAATTAKLSRRAGVVAGVVVGIVVGVVGVVEIVIVLRMVEGVVMAVIGGAFSAVVVAVGLLSAQS